MTAKSYQGGHKVIQHKTRYGNNFDKCEPKKDQEMTRNGRSQKEMPTPKPDVGKTLIDN